MIKKLFGRIRWLVLRVVYKSKGVRGGRNSYADEKCHFGHDVNLYSKISNCYLEGGNTIYANMSNSSIGYGSYIGYSPVLEYIKIGRFCSIGQGLRVIRGQHPSSIMVSTAPCFFSLKKQSGFTYVTEQKYEEHNWVEKDKVSALIGNDVWIGDGVSIKEGVTIGDGAIVGACSFVTKDVAPYSIVAGVPAKNIRYRFNDSQIHKLLDIKWWDKPIEWIEDNASLFENIDSFLAKIDNPPNGTV